MMKTTQFIANIKLWQGIFFSFLLLVSLNLNSQNVGDDLLANSNGQVDTSSGWTGSGAGCFSWGGGTYDGVTQCGWTSGAGLNYAPSNGNHGPTHSGDRMFKSYKTNGTNGEFIAQEVGELALGTYTYSFFHRWTGGSIDYTEGAPKFTIKEQNADGGWDNVLAVDLVEGNTGAAGEWTETTGTWVNENVNNYKIQVYKNGVANAGLAQNLHLDTFSFVYTEEASTSSGCDLTINMVDSYGDGWNGGELNVLVNGVSVGTYANTSDAAANEAQTVSLSTSYGDDVTFDFTCGSYCSETSFSVTDADGNTVASGGGNSTSGDATYSCVDPAAVNLSVSATTGAGSATFSFDVANFTVGASGDTGVDGHIHYSLNGGSEVMVYSADDLTLSGLPNGDHTIVFSLVDESHQPLDPAVEATVAFTTSGGAVACDETYSYTYGNNESGTLFSASNPGGEVTVTVTGQTENNYDDLIITDGAGNVLYSASGDHTGQAITSTDGTIYVEIDSDGSVSGYTLDFAVTCAASQSNVTFNVNMSNYTGGLGADDTVYLNGSFNGWCGDCNPMSDDDGDGIWTITIPLDDGNYEYKFTVNGWSNQESWPGDGTPVCAENADDGTYENRAFTVAGADMTLETVYWNLCIGEEPGNTYTVTFSVNTSAIVGGVGANGIYAGGGVLGNAQALQLFDDDGDGVWVGSIDLPEGTTGNYIFLNSPNDGGDWGTKENLEGQDCADPNNYNDRILPEVTGDTTILACFGECSGDGTGECPSGAVTWMLTMTVNTANITVGENGMYLGGGYFGGANAYEMLDDDNDGTWEVTVEVADGASGNYAFFNSPNASDDWGTKENIEGQDCADPANYNDRILEAVTADTTLMHCFASCETDGSCGVTEDGMMVLQGIIDFTVPSAGSDGKAIHVLVTEDIADLTNYGIGVANNGGGTDGQEYVFPEGSATAGQHILVARSLEAMEAYGMTGFDQVLQASSDISQNGDDAIELYFGGGVIEVFGDTEVDGTGEAWEYMDSWAYKVEGAWTYGEVNCTDGSTTTCDSGCPYPFVECAAPVTFPLCEDFEDGTEGWTFVDLGGLTSDWQIDTPANGDSTAALGHGYLPSDAAYDDWAISPSYDTSGLADGTATVSYYEYLNWSADATAHNVWYSTDYAGDPAAATWVLLNDVIGTDAEDVFVQRTFDIPSAASIVIGFQFNSTYGADWNIDDICIDGTLSTSDNEILDMMVYPNPVDGNYVTIVTPVQGSKEIQVFTVTGRKVMDTVINGNTLDVSSFNSGFYMLKVTVDGQSKVSKLVVR